MVGEIIMWMVIIGSAAVIAFLAILLYDAVRDEHKMRQDTIDNIKSEEKRLKDYPSNHIEVILFRQYKELAEDILLRNPRYYRPPIAPHLTSVTMYCKRYGIKTIIYPPEWKGEQVDQSRLK